jgi:hypothetical protein
MLQFRADCIRVTHPYDTLVQVLLLKLPFVLHVLGLPLAFILSQDQTLHSINLQQLTCASPLAFAVHNLFSRRTRKPMSFNPRSRYSCPCSLHRSHYYLESTHGTPLSKFHGSAINHSFKERRVLSFSQSKNRGRYTSDLEIF